MFSTRLCYFPKLPRLALLKRTWPAGLIAFCLAAIQLLGAGPLPIQRLTTCDESSFRRAVEQGGTIQCECEGTLMLTSELLVAKDTVIDCSKPGFILSGNQTVRVLHVNPGVSLTLLNLKIIHGKSFRGGGLLNDGGKVTVSNCVFEANLAAGDPNPEMTHEGKCASDALGCTAEGGAVYTSGTFSATETLFSLNIAQGRPGIAEWLRSRGGDAAGGAICGDGGVVDLLRCNFQSNRARGGQGRQGYPLGIPGTNNSSGGFAEGGVVVVRAGEVTMSSCLAEGNTAEGGQGGLIEFGYLVAGMPGGAACGGVIYCGGLGRIRACSFQNNQVRGGDFGGGGGQTDAGVGGEASGGAIYNVGQLTMVANSLVRNSADGGGGGGQASGGAAYNSGQLTMDGNALVRNSSTGSHGSVGRDGTSGDRNTATAGYPGINGGGANGGGVFNRGRASFRNCTWAENRIVGGVGGAGGRGGTNYFGRQGVFGGFVQIILNNGANGKGGDTAGGALANHDGTVSLINCTLANNLCLPGKFGGSSGGGLQSRAGAQTSLVNTLLAFNLADTNAANAAGLLSDLGHNLSSDGTCAWTRTSSRSQIDPKLGGLDDHSGATPTLPLLADSPARDSGSTLAGPAADQRGVVRPFGPATDIGAVEYENTNTPEPFRLAAVAEGAMTLRWKGGPGIRVQRAKFLNSGGWEDIADTLGKHDAILKPDESVGYFRLHITE